MSSVVSATEYVVRTRFELGKVGGASHLTALNKQLQALQGLSVQLGGIGTQLRTAFGGLGVLASSLGFAAAVGGVAMLAGQVVSLNAEIETAKYGIATMFNVQNGGAFEDSMGMASDTLNKLRKDARMGVGELTDYVQGFQRIGSAAMPFGATADQVQALNRLVIAAGAASGLPGGMGMRQATLDIPQALNRGVVAGVTPFVERALAASGINAATFNAYDKAKRFEVMAMAFGRYEAAANAYASTWDARISTLRDYLKDIFRMSTGGLFSRWSEQLANVNQWLERHWETIGRIADDVGGRLVAAWDTVSSRIPQLGSSAAGGVAAAGTLGLTTLGPSIGPVLVRALAATGPWGLAAAAIVGGLTSAMVLAFSQDSEMFGLFSSRMGLLATTVIDVTTSISTALGDLSTSLGIGGVFAGLLTFWTGGVALFLGELSILMDGVVDVAGWLGHKASAQWKMATGDVSGYWREKDLADKAWASTSAKFAPGGEYFARMDEYARQYEGLGKPKSTTGKEGDGKPSTTNNNNNFTGPITIKVTAERLDDPNTVAATMDEILRRLNDHPLRARAQRYGTGG